MKQRNLYLNLIIIFSVFSACNDDVTGKIMLTKNGTSDYEIVLKNEASQSQHQSAQELVKYIKLISQAELNLVDESHQTARKKKIYVGKTIEKNLAKDEILITSLNEDIYVTGGSDNAIQNSVYIFLENYLNCKWYAPEVESIPNTPTIILDTLFYSYKPDITTRTVHSRLFYENPKFADQQKVTHESFPYYAPEARVHTFHKFLPEEKFYKEHPEYFALRGDQRLPTQLCLTNAKVLEIVKDSVAAIFKRHPEASVVSVSQDDNQQHCQCRNCSKIDKSEGSPAGTMIQFVNKVAEAFPEKTIATLAYQYTRKPCKTKPAKNVLITLCSIECDRSAPIAEKCTDFAEDLIGWGKLTENIRIWDYTTQFTNFLAPFPNLRTLKPNIELFKNNNAKWVFEQHSNNPSELFELRSYITSKLLWNADESVDDLIVEFTNGYYKEAGPFIKQYIDLVHSELEKDNDFFLFLYGDPSEAFNSYLSPQLLSTYSQLFDAAEKAVAPNSELIDRVKSARLGVDYAVLEASRKNSTKLYSLMKRNNQGEVIENPFVKSLLENFKETCVKNSISLMNEMGFTVEEYYTNYLAAINVAKKPNMALGKKVKTITKPKKYANENPMVLTDGALGGSSFYANWLGYEGNNMEVLLDLDSPQQVSTISMAFLQVTNHIVFLPESVSFYGSVDGENFVALGTVKNKYPLTKKSKVNDIQYFDLTFDARQMQYIKIIAKNTKTPYWHHAAGLPSWIFADEILVE